MAFNTEKKMEHFQQNWQNRILNEIWKKCIQNLTQPTFFKLFSFFDIISLE